MQTKKTRQEIVPSSYDTFLDDFTDWAKRYIKILGSRSRFLTFEYVMLKNVNDTDMHAEKLADLSVMLGHVKVNLIPYNFTDVGLESSSKLRMEEFMNILRKKNVVVTLRKTMGDDIAAACGQLISEGNKE